MSIPKTVSGTITNDGSSSDLSKLTISLYKKMKDGDAFLGFAVPNGEGEFTISFDYDKDERKLEDNLYFVVQIGGLNVYESDTNLNQGIRAELGDNNQIKVTDENILKYVNRTQAEGWEGGFADSNSAFEYPKPDLTSLPLYDNMANIDLLTRQQKIIWPEFSWLANPNDKDKERSRRFQMFAPDISRVGYNDAGRCYSIICPQQGASLGVWGTLNVEVTVTGNRGWVDEATKSLATDMRVTGKVWFGESLETELIIKVLKLVLKAMIEVFNKLHKNKIKIDLDNYAFPTSKAHAIHVKTSLCGDPSQPTFPLQDGLSPLFKAPDFTRHEHLSWSQGHIDVQIGKVWKTGNKIVDAFNQIVIDLFNSYQQNMLKEKNVLSWNVWFAYPEVVDQYEWGTHAERWRRSIEVDHSKPSADRPLGNGTIIRNSDGNFVPSPPITKEGVLEIIGKSLRATLPKEALPIETLLATGVANDLETETEGLKADTDEILQGAKNDLDTALTMLTDRWEKDF